jgi:hypothetical protein
MTGMKAMSTTKVDALAEYVRYLAECIAEGNIEPQRLEHWIRDGYGCSWAELGER